MAYFDGPGGTQVPRAVGEAMTDYLFNHNANTHWAFPTSHETDQALANARQVFADFLNATPGEVVFGANMSTLTFHHNLARAAGPGIRTGRRGRRDRARPPPSIDPWREMAQDRGLSVRAAHAWTRRPASSWDDLRRQMSDRTKLLAIGAASNALGTINDVAAAGRMAHDAGALVFVDAVHYAPHRLVDVRALGLRLRPAQLYKFAPCVELVL